MHWVRLANSDFYFHQRFASSNQEYALEKIKAMDQVLSKTREQVLRLCYSDKNAASYDSVCRLVRLGF